MSKEKTNWLTDGTAEAMTTPNPERTREVSEALRLYGDAMFDCGAHQGRMPHYEIKWGIAEQRKAALLELLNTRADKHGDKEMGDAAQRLRNYVKICRDGVAMATNHEQASEDIELLASTPPSSTDGKTEGKG